jgi:hypothetical protein
VTDICICRSRHRTPIHKLDDDSLLNIFYLYRLARLIELLLWNESSVFEGTAWIYESWWYQLTHVCQRWRCLILTSASYLRLCLVCTHGTPIADMLAHSPPLPLMVYYPLHDITAEDEEINLALGYRDRIRRINLRMQAQNFHKVLTAIDNEFPILEDLMILLPANPNTSLVLPRTFQAPQLRRLISSNFGLIGFPLLATATGIVLLSLTNIHPSAYFPPNDLIQHLSHMPQLQTLRIGFHSPVPNLDVERPLLQTLITTHVTLPNLRQFDFKGTSAYLEALLPQIAPPLLEEFNVTFFSQLTFSVPSLLQFVMLTAENLTGSDATLHFGDDLVRFAVHSGVPRRDTLVVAVLSDHLDWQVSSITQLVNAFDAVFSVVENLSILYSTRIPSLEVHSEVDHTQWRTLFGSFRNVKTLRGDFHQEDSGFLKLDDGESPMVLFPELNELSVPARAVGDVITSFIDARRNTDRPVTLVYR